ncbi:unnamed protein product [Dibothriocephalus latus]|uniref:Phosphoserine phosphatase n=1 Tax=Dibothriocephalus latus TaxID=60516 RepID=A0A3P7L073_DIBLA|nr:unnamed protein product [Dibothriocephalus latus]
MAVDFSKVTVVCFDVDSTVCTNEGIDELAVHMGKAEFVSEMYDSPLIIPPPLELEELWLVRWTLLQRWQNVWMPYN